jgi:hypothetical protein
VAIQREKIGVQVKRILAARANLDLATGMLFNARSQLAVKRKKITLIGLFVSDENTFLIRPHVFETKKEGRNAVQWDAWLADNYGKILRDNILPGMEIRTDKQWRLYRVIGWLPGDNTGLVRAKVDRKRNKTKRKRRQNGRSSTRSR